MTHTVIPKANINDTLLDVIAQYTPVRLGCAPTSNAMFVERETFDSHDCAYLYSAVTDLSSCTGHYVLIAPRASDVLPTCRIVPFRVDGDECVAVLNDPKLLGKKVLCVFDKAAGRFVFAVGHAKPWTFNAVKVFDEDHALFEA